VSMSIARCSTGIASDASLFDNAAIRAARFWCDDARRRTRLGLERCAPRR